MITGAKLLFCLFCISALALANFHENPPASSSSSTPSNNNKPSSTTQTKPATATPSKPAATTPSKPAATTPSTPAQSKPATTTPSTPAQSKPAATTPSTPAQSKPAAAAPPQSAATAPSKSAATAPSKSTATAPSQSAATAPSQSASNQAPSQTDSSTVDDSNPGRHPIPEDNIWESVMMDMMHDMETSVTKKTSNNPDIDFCTMMIPHHWGAIFMCEEERKIGYSSMLFEMCDQIIWSQLKDIIDMEDLLKKYNYQFLDPSIFPQVDYVVEWGDIRLDPVEYEAQGVVPYWRKVGRLLGKGVTYEQYVKTIKYNENFDWNKVLVSMPRSNMKQSRNSMKIKQSRRGFGDLQ